MDISPDKQNIDSVFSNTKYHIDFYQREYRWNQVPVLRLLDDVFYKFNENYLLNKDLPPDSHVIESKYPWYYLNTYVTNKVDGKVFIVDGQQRLTTLSLILNKLFHLAESYDSQAKKWLDSKIIGQDGFQSEFWLTHSAHKPTQQAIYNNRLDDADTSTGITAVNLVANYKTISDYLDNNLDSKHKFETFVYYFMRRLVIINLTVEQTDVPMVFEVINDRGVSLKPYEILKGKILGQIDKTVLYNNKYHQLWEERITAINKFDENEADRFFRFYLKARFADSRAEAQSYDGDYHRIMFSNEFSKFIDIAHNQNNAISFLENDFRYYTQLYIKARKSYDTDSDKSAFTYNRVNDLDGAMVLILSACQLNDEQENIKVDILPKELDRLFSLLQLQNAYDSNAFQSITYKISKKIRNSHVSDIRQAFDEALLNELSRVTSITVDKTFQYKLFKNTGINLNMRFKRYFFSRIEKFLSDNLNLGMKHPVSDLVSKTGAKTGFHIEHILSYNDENLSLFNYDEDKFHQERNRLGGILLLKGKDNISSNNEVFAEKLRSYASTLYWNETLREDTYKSKLDIKDLNQKYQLNLEPISIFDDEALEKRQKILFNISSIIWQ
ncbi:DUF262 domain-containing protein [uncultured Psychrobacter sp.]|uniref:DUF262 domain-containing protein n=1 Tax=uncultured Psychrobacter sp. TaxID=259303 RepID=UPI00262FB2E5|nr:DUF262 domain-containing protein [uncultured Psychrobacter sp.]